jgi:hypothetical protein
LESLRLRALATGFRLARRRASSFLQLGLILRLGSRRRFGQPCAAALFLFLLLLLRDLWFLSAAVTVSLAARELRFLLAPSASSTRVHFFGLLLLGGELQLPAP